MIVVVTMILIPLLHRGIIDMYVVIVIVEVEAEVEAEAVTMTVRKILLL